jgi:hypothetical protein
VGKERERKKRERERITSDFLNENKARSYEGTFIKY